MFSLGTHASTLVAHVCSSVARFASIHASSHICSNVARFDCMHASSHIESMLVQQRMHACLLTTKHTLEYKYDRSEMGETSESLPLPNASATITFDAQPLVHRAQRPGFWVWSP